MEKTQVKRLLSFVLCVMMVLSLMPSVAFAAEDNDAPEQSVETTVVPAEEETSDTEGADEAIAEGEEPAPSEASEDENTEEAAAVEHNIIAYSNSYDIAPGVVESNLTVNDSTGENPNKAYVFHVEKGAENAYTMASYKGVDGRSGGAQTMSAQAAYAEESLGVNVVGAINVNWRSDSDEPMGMLIINGDVQHTEICSYAYFVQNTDGTYELREGTEPLIGSEQNAVTFGDWLVKDEVNQYSEDYSQDNRAPRTAIGLKADGSLVVFVSEGSPISAGLTPYETAKILLDLGCVNAVSCTGDGTSAFLSKRDSTEELKLRNATASGTEDETHTGLLIVSTVEEIEEPASSEVDSEEDSVLPDDAEADEPDSAAESETATTSASDDYFRVISKKSYAVAPGAVESNYVLNDVTGQNQNKAYVMEIDMSNSDITVVPSYKNMDPTNYGTQVMSEQAAAAVKKGYNVVGAINVNLSWDTIEPLGMLVIDGKVYHEDTTQGGGYLVVHKDNTAELRPASQPLDGSEWQAISPNFGWLVRNGVNQCTDQTHTSASRAPRTCIGIKADGSIMLLVVDGRQDPVSVGMSMCELAETLINLGCVDAMNCDGGGSSTFISQREGGSLTVKNVPSDGTERATLGGLLVVSNAIGDGVFNHASVTADSDYYTPNSEVTFSAVGVDKAGAAAELPEEGLSWKLVDETMGTISDSGVFTSNGKLGEVEAQLLYNGEVCGSYTISIIEPDSISFFETSRSFGFSVTEEMSMLVQGQGHTITYKASDFTWDVELISANDASVTDPAQIGWIEEGTTKFTSNPSLSGDLKVTAKYTKIDGMVLQTTATIAVGKLPSVFWDYEDGVQMVEVWEEVEKTDESTGEVTKEWQIKRDENGNIVYESKYFDAENYYSSLMVKKPSDVTIDEQRASHFGLRSDRNAQGHTEIVDINSGEPVRFGDKSLKLCYDFTKSTGAPSVLGYGYMQNTNYAPGSPTALGMWIYVPEGTPGYSLKSIVQSAGKAVYLTYGYTYIDENGETVTTTSLGDMAGKGWIYVTASLEGKGDGTFKMLRNYTIRLIAEGFIEHPDRYAAGSVYLDNIEFIYGYDNKDTVNPSVTSVYDYNTDEAIAKDGSSEFSKNTISFAATFADDDGEFATGMDLNSIRAYIDGVNMVDHPGFVVTQDNLMVLPNVHLANGLHSLRVRIRDNYGNETNEVRYFTVNGSETCDTNMTFQPVEGAAPYLGTDYTLALTSDNCANIQSATVAAQFNTTFGEPVVKFADGFTGSYTYGSGTGELTLNVTKGENADSANGQIALLTFHIPDSLTQGTNFSYSVTSGQFATVETSSFTNSFSFPTVNVPVQAYYTVQAEDGVVGYPFKIHVKDEDGKAAARVYVHVDGIASDAVTDDEGCVEVTLDKAGEVNAYAYSNNDGAVQRSWNQRIVIHTIAGDGTAAPWFIQNNASSAGKSITWLSNIAVAKDAAVLRLYAENPAENESAEYKEYTGTTALVHFSEESARICTVKLNGLAEGVTYYYTVGDGETWSEPLSFSMNKEPGKTNFFIIGDTQTTNTENVGKILNSLSANGTSYDFAIQTGDAVDDSSRYVYWNALSNVFNAKTMNGVDLIHVLGNHEFYGDVNGEIPNAMYDLPATGDGSFYSVEYGNVYVAVINYSSTGQYKEAFEQLVKDAQASTCRWKVLAMHVPAYGTNAEAFNSFVHDNLPKAVQAAGIDFVFSGHDHSYARTKPMTDGVVDENGVVYFICGSTGEKSYNVSIDPAYNFEQVNDSYGAMYMTVEASSDSITVYAKDVNGELIDTYTKHFKACADYQHPYRCDLKQGTVSCARCGDMPSGIITAGGKLYYAIDGKLYTGWRSALDSADLYYFSTENYAALTGTATVDGKQFVFNDNGVLIRGAFVNENGGTRYYFGKHWLASKWIVLDEGTYWVDGEGYVVHGYYPHQEYNHADYYWYHFDENTGLLIGKCSGFVTYKGEHYWCDENGKVFYGAVKVDGGIIFTGSMGKVYKNSSCYIDGNTIGCELQNGSYWCDENGYIVKDGFVEISGKTYYFSDYIRAKGFTKVGDDYYMFNAGSGMMYKDANMWVPANDYGVDAGMHYFDADGKMYVPNLESGPRKIIEENGKLYYTVDGVKLTNGLYELDGEYYFAQYNCVLLTNGSTYVETSLLSGNGWYAFDENAKLIKTGFVNGGGKTYYYADGVRAKGFTKIGDDYYMFNAGSGMMYKDANMWVPANDYGVDAGMHYFDADGKMHIPDLESGPRKIIEENGKLYYTVDGVKLTNGLYELDGEYYFAQYNCVLLTNGSTYVETSLLSGNGWYAFDENAKLIKTGFVNGGGKTYYYADGVRAKGFTKIGDDYYMFNAGSGMMYKDANMWVPANDYGVDAGMHYFDADGKMTDK